MASNVLGIIPEIFSAQILDAKENRHLFGGLANRNYEGDLQKGGSVRIPQVGYPTVNNYTRNSTSNLAVEGVVTGSMWLTIDYEKFVHQSLDQVDLKQAGLDLQMKVAQRTGYAIADSQDAIIAGLYGQCGIKTTSNSSSSRVTLGSSNVKTEFLLMAEAFANSNIYEPIWAVIPNKLHSKLVDAGILEQSNNDRTWEVGRVANAYGITVYKSNNVNSTATGSFNIIFGTGTESLTMAEQILETDFYKQTNQGFGWAYKALHVYGTRFITDRAGVLYATVN